MKLSLKVLSHTLEAAEVSLEQQDVERIGLCSSMAGLARERKEVAYAQQLRMHRLHRGLGHRLEHMGYATRLRLRHPHGELAPVDEASKRQPVGVGEHDRDATMEDRLDEARRPHGMATGREAEDSIEQRVHVLRAQEAASHQPHVAGWRRSVPVPVEEIGEDRNPFRDQV